MNGADARRAATVILSRADGEDLIGPSEILRCAQDDGFKTFARVRRGHRHPAACPERRRRDGEGSLVAQIEILRRLRGSDGGAETPNPLPSRPPQKRSPPPRRRGRGWPGATPSAARRSRGAG